MIPLGLYLHVPWCVRKCPYCDFNSHEPTGPPDFAGYFAALERELLAAAPLLAARPVTSVFFGGGTPSLTPPEHVGRFLTRLDALGGLGADAEITLEANPGTVDLDHLPGYRAAGVDRLSLGVQSFDDGALSRLGRIHDGASARHAIEAARRAGFRALNVDLMHGLPSQDVKGAVADLTRALDAGVEHVSWYQLTIEPNTRFHAAPPELPEEAELAGIEAAGAAVLARAGFERYEVSAWCRPGARCRHNSNYWRFGDYLGLGAGAHGKLSTADPAAPGGLHVERRRNVRRPEGYLRAVEPCVERAPVPAEARTGEFLMNALRLLEGVPASLYEARTGLSAAELLARAGTLRDRGLLDPSPGLLRVTALGLRFLDDVVAAFV